MTGVCYSRALPYDPPRQRAEKRKASSEARQRLNLKFSWQKLEQLLACNFDNGDLFLTLTYDENHLPPGREAAVKQMRRFIRLLREVRKKRGEKLLYVYNVEGQHSGGRIHHHMVLNATGEDYEEIKSLWQGGQAKCKTLKFDSGHTYEELARYLTKEPREYGQREVGARTWFPSLGLARPAPPETATVPDSLTLAVPAGAQLLEFTPETRNGYGCYSYIKYLLPEQIGRRRRRARAKRKYRAL